MIISTNLIMSQNDSYYWYKNKKLSLEEIDSKKFVIFELERNDSVNIQKLFSDKNIAVRDMSAKENVDGIPKKWAVVDKTTFENLKQKKLKICYEGSFFRNPRNIEAGLTNVFYIKLNNEDDRDLLESLAKENKVKIIDRNKFMPLWFTLSCSEESNGNALVMANKFYESKLFAASEPEFMIQNMTSCADDTYFSYQWNLAQTNQYGNNNWVNIDLCQGLGYINGNSSIIVAIIDRGVELDHPDLNIYPISYDTDTGDSLSYVNDAHGTLVAGVTGAKRNNSLGISGIAPGCPVMSISSNLSYNTTITQKLADGINFAWQNSASVINCSWYAMEHQLLDNAIDSALIRGRNGLGCVVVCASGNNDFQSIDYPACSNDDILVVGACSPCGERKNINSCDGEDVWGSNYGGQLDIMAPGVLIPTTDMQGDLGVNPDIPLHTESGGNIITNDFSNQNYTVWFNGTSAAAPHVSGVAALILSLNTNSNLKGKYVNKLIESCAQKVGGYTYDQEAGRPNGTWCEDMGYGLLNAYEPLNLESQHPTTSILNRNFSSFTERSGDNVYVEDVHVTNDSDFIIYYTSGLIINSNFSVAAGSTFNTY